MRLREAKTKKKDTNLEIDKFRHEVAELKAHRQSAVLKGTSVKIPKTEL